MNILTIVKGLLSLSSAIMRWAGDRQLIEAGEANSVAENLKEQTERINKALAARRNVDPDRVSDKYNRD